MHRVSAVLVVALLGAAGEGLTSVAATSTGTTSTLLGPVDCEEIRGELLEMASTDQEEREQYGDPDAGPWHDEERTARLGEIIDQCGWPTPDLVGVDGTSAAWLIAQHSDSDPEFQQRVLSLMNDAAEYSGKANQVAYLTDRVAANTGRPQVYGTQVGCADGVPVPNPELERPDEVDQLRRDAGLEPLDQYLALGNQRCADLAQMPIDAGCDRLAGVSGLLQPNTAILVGELHGTVESPAFVGALACRALSYGYAVVIGLEIPDGEAAAVEDFLASDGEPDAAAALLRGPFWAAESADGRQSAAMLELLDALREHAADGASVDVVLLDSSTSTDRDVAMADRLVEALEARPDGVAIALTGNVHGRGTRGTSFDDDYDPMGYLVRQTLGDRAVTALDVSYSAEAPGSASRVEPVVRTRSMATPQRQPSRSPRAYPQLNSSVSPTPTVSTGATSSASSRHPSQRL